MMIPKAERQKVYEHLFQEGVLVANSNLHQPKHEGTGVRNLWVVKMMQSFKSRGFVREQYSWRMHYYFLTDEGIEYLREYLHLPAEIVPATLKSTKAEREREARMQERDERRGGDDRRGGGRGRDGGFAKKETGPAPGFRPEFAGAGRGAAPTAQ